MRGGDGRVKEALDRPAVDLVLEERDHGIGPVADVVGRLLVADRDEPGRELLELVVREPVDRIGGLGGKRALVGLLLPRLRERDEPRVAGNSLDQLLEQLIDPPVAFGREGRDGTLQVLAVVIGQGRRWSRRRR